MLLEGLVPGGCADGAAENGDGSTGMGPGRPIDGSVVVVLRDSSSSFFTFFHAPSPWASLSAGAAAAIRCA